MHAEKTIQATRKENSMTNMLVSVDQVGFEPAKDVSADVVRHPQSLDKESVVDCVERGRQIQQGQCRQITGIDRQQNA